MFDSASNKIESVKGFSKGTIDQVYLAMRFGINKVVSENTNPFILDDAFVNYDGQRLKQVISIIAEDSKEEDRQVILFSCQEREAELLKELKLGANVITI
jgi:exonuclease SbcC